MKLISHNEYAWQQLPGYRKNVLLTGEELHDVGACVQLVAVEPGETIPDHYHKTSYEVYYVLQGSCRLFVNGEEIMLNLGVVLLMEPGDVHKLTNNGSQRFLLLVFKTNAKKNDTYWSN